MNATARTLVWIDFAGDPDPRGFPYIDRDGGLITRLHEHMGATGIGFAQVSRLGGGRFSVGFAPEQALDVIGWLRAQGIDVDAKL